MLDDEPDEPEPESEEDEPDVLEVVAAGVEDEEVLRLSVR